MDIEHCEVFIKFIVGVGVCPGVRVPWYTLEGQRRLGSVFSPFLSVLRVEGIELRWSGWAEKPLPEEPVCLPELLINKALGLEAKVKGSAA